MATLAEVEQRLVELERRVEEHLREWPTVPAPPDAPSVDTTVAPTSTTTVSGGLT